MDNTQKSSDIESRLYYSLSHSKRIMDINANSDNHKRNNNNYCKACEKNSNSLTTITTTTTAGTTTTTTMSCTSSLTEKKEIQGNCSSKYAHSYASCPFHLQSQLSLRRFCTFLLLCTFLTSAYACGPGRGIGGARRNRKLTPLVFKQHVPNMSEKTLGASGLSEGAIHRNSPKFKDLVPNYNKDIDFKDEEGTGADHIMTRRCKESLNTLAVSVMNQWPGVRLRVTESWDEEYLHGADSLHYEGRAVDITTSDRDRTKYGMLARLAVEAGFDWVYYESRAHIHCSVKSDANHIPHMNGCFTPDSTVLTASGERKKMHDLIIGDRVLSMTESGEPIYSEVILFMDRNLEQSQEFVQLRTESGRQLTVTPSHLVMAWNRELQTVDYVFADRVEEGDFLFVHESSGQLRPERVVELKVALRKGVIAPLTMSGTIVVDSIAASCYAVVNSQSLAHWSLAPMRLLALFKSWLPCSNSKATCSKDQPKIHPKIALSASANKTNTKFLLTTAQQENGVHWYTKSLFKLKDYVLPKDWVYQ